MRSFFVLLLLLPALSFALGDLAHNYVAEKSAQQAQTTDARLQNVLTLYQNAYLVGSDYPDTGYVPGFHFGEVSHWPSFVTPFADYIKKTCAHPATPDLQTHCDKLTAFLLGVATHVKSDIISHWTYYDLVALHDFGSDNSDNWSKAHDAMDPASDFYVIVRKGIYDHPLNWWIPVTDLVNVYDTMYQKHMIEDRITAKEIIEANAIYYIATGLTEDVIAYPAYAYDALHYIPWGIAHLEDPDPAIGAFPEMTRQSALYIEAVWNQIHGQEKLENQLSKKIDGSLSGAPLMHFIKQSIDNGTLTIQPTTDSFGDVIFTKNTIHFSSPTAKTIFYAKASQLQESAHP